jgi:hypothetical protein
VLLRVLGRQDRQLRSVLQCQLQIHQQQLLLLLLGQVLLLVCQLIKLCRLLVLPAAAVIAAGVPALL